jgi:uncharacterized caspase-like protein
MIATVFVKAIEITGRRLFRAGLLAAFALAATFGAAQASYKRVALVIGNSSYEHAPKLINPANDADDMAVTLRGMGFDVVEGRDLDLRSMRSKIREFSKLLQGAEVGMLFYAGHGLQVGGENYLAPVDAKLEVEADLDFETFKLSFIQDQMEREAKTILLFLDACRDNPLTGNLRGKSRSLGRGLAEVKSAPGTLIAFATDPNNVALDGSGRNSPFTAALLENISRPDIEIQTMMTDVRQQVFTSTDERQTPWINSSLLGRFYFVTGDAPADEVAEAPAFQATVATEGPSAPRSTSRQEEAAVAWDAVKESDSAEELRLFALTYPNTFHAKLANMRITKLDSGENQRVASLDVDDTDRNDVSLHVLGKTELERARDLENTLSPNEITLQVQQQLNRLNCAPGRPDGVWGRRSRGALERLRANTTVEPVSTDPDARLLVQLQDYKGEGCPRASTPTVAQGTARGFESQSSQPQQRTTKSSRRQQAIDNAVPAFVGGIVGGFIGSRF